MTRLGVIPALMLAASAWAQPNVRPTTRTPNCTVAGCHAPVIDHQLLHGPTAIGACTVCHDSDNEVAHTFRLKRDEADLCTFCHIGADTPIGPIGHQPFTEGKCIGCHDPHGSHDQRLLRGESVSQMCIECHSDYSGGMFTHASEFEGECLGCHGAHGSTHAKLLSAPVEQMCLTCHAEVGVRAVESSHAHPPAVQNCLDCHDPHQSDFDQHLIDAPRALCLSCHDNVARVSDNAQFQHAAVTEGQACIQCHQPHGSNNPGMLHSDPVGTCLECHSQPVTTPDGREIPDIVGVLAEHAIPHGPVASGNCTACHDLHGAEHKFLLNNTYSENFYDSYSEENFALCFSCHSNHLAENPTTAGDTLFRNGDQNLHFVHVNKPEQGRTCRACHATHATTSPKNIAEMVPYGQWMMPLKFAVTETGGSCNSGCHLPAVYDRVNPAIGLQRLNAPPTPTDADSSDQAGG